MTEYKIKTFPFIFEYEYKGKQYALIRYCPLRPIEIIGEITKELESNYKGNEEDIIKLGWRNDKNSLFVKINPISLELGISNLEREILKDFSKNN
tara:strand:+ start:3572 stop:3856 length:285 start_codon:yes stop_codon:yes gene_type:complete